MLAVKIQRIRGCYRSLVRTPNRSSIPLAMAMATSGNRASPVQMLFTVASMVAAVHSILGDAGLGAAGWATCLPKHWERHAVGIIVGVIVLACIFCMGTSRPHE